MPSSEVKPTILLVNDDPLEILDWQRELVEFPTVNFIRPTVPRKLREKRWDRNYLRAVKEAASTLITLLMGSDLSYINIAFIDQFVTEPRLMESSAKLVSKIRRQNPQANIVETSYAPSGKVYGESDSTLDGQDFTYLLSIIVNILSVQNQGNSHRALIQQITHHSHEASVQAERASRANPDDFDFAISLNKLAAYEPELKTLLELLGVELSSGEIDESLNYTYDLIDPLKNPEKQKAMHNVWTIVLHLRRRHDQSYYDLPLMRLQETLRRE